MTKLEQDAINRLPEIVAATVAGGYVFAEAFDMTYLLENELAECNDAIHNPVNAEEVATRATQKGIEYVAANCVVTANCTIPTASAETKVEEPKPERKSNMSFEIENVALPVSKRGGATRSSKYPFEILEVGQSFFVANTEKHPDMVKSMASAVTNAMKKYDVPDLDENGVQKTKGITVPKTGEKRTIPATKHTRIFGIRPDTKDGVAGARIGRTA
jgi:hypothetical protein